MNSNNLSINLSIDSDNKNYLSKSFLSKIYFYYVNNGYYNIISTQLVNIFIGLFIIIYTNFLFKCVLWRKLFSLNSKMSLEEVLDINNFFKLNYFSWILLIMYIHIFCCKLYNIVSNAYEFNNIKKFYNDHLKIEDNDLSTIKWQEVIAKFKTFYDDENLNIYYINNKISVKDNYFITIIDKNILKLDYLNELMEWNIRFCFIDSLFKEDFKLKNEFILLREDFVTSVERKIKNIALLNFIFMPFILVYLLFFDLFKYGERFYNKPQLIFLRHWTKIAKWKLRNYNELYHESHDKFVSSYPYCNEYSAQFPNRILETFSKFIVFILSAFFVVLILISIVNENILLNLYIVKTKTTIWFIGIFASLIAIFNSFIKEKIIFYPREKLKKISSIINSLPKEWVEEDNFKVKHKFLEYYQLQIVTLFKDIITTLIIPFKLYKLSLNTRNILEYIQHVTINHPNYGHINKFALFTYNHCKDKKTLYSIETFKKNNDGWSV